MKRLTLIIVAIALASCTTTSLDKANTADLAMASTACQTFSTISYDGKLDTQATKDQIKTYNAKRKAFCAGTGH